MTPHSPLSTFFIISFSIGPSSVSTFKKLGKALGKGMNKGVQSAHQGITGKGPEYSTGYQKALGEQAYRRQLVAQPFGTTVLLVILYLAFSVWPFPFLPAFNFLTLFWAGFVLYLMFSRNYMWGIIFIIIFPLFNYAFAMDIFSTGQVFGEGLRERISFTNPIENFKGWIYGTYGTWKNPDVVEQEPKKGVQILSFATNDLFKEETPTQIDAKIQIDGFYDPLLERYEEQQVSFSCYEEDRQGKRVQEGEIYVDDEPQLSIIVDEATSIHYASCRFPQGMKIQTTDTPVAGSLFGVEEGVEVGDKIVTKKRVVFEAHSRMLQVAGLKLWTVTKANAPEDITSVVNDPTLEKDGKSRPQCRRGCGGPYFVTLTTGVMPITETKSPRLQIAFTRNEQRFGTLERLNSVRLFFPQELSFQLGKTADEQPTSCDFDTGGDLLPDRLKTANQRISALVNFTSDDAPSLSLDFSCGYQVGSPLDKLGFHEISVRADYAAVIRRRGLVEVYRDKPVTGGENLA